MLLVALASREFYMSLSCPCAAGPVFLFSAGRSVGLMLYACCMCQPTGPQFSECWCRLCESSMLLR